MTHPALARAHAAISALAVLLALLCTAAEASAQRLKVILDTDIGDDIDDAWALGLAMQSPALDLVGVTITHGNTPARAKVACKLLHVGGRDDVPVAVGRKTGDEPEYQFTWAEDFTAKAPVTQPAADFIVETVRKQPGEITLVAVGPLENVADALRKDPGIAKLFKRVVLMSGSIGGVGVAIGPDPRVERRRVDPGRAGGVRRRAADHDRAARLHDVRHAQGRGARAASQARFPGDAMRSRRCTACGSRTPRRA